MALKTEQHAFSHKEKKEKYRTLAFATCAALLLHSKKIESLNLTRKMV